MVKRPAVEKPQKKKRSKTSLLITLLFIVGILCALVTGALLLQNTDSRLNKITSSTQIRGHALIEQALTLFRGYQQMIVIGYSPADITFNDNGEGDMFLTHQLVREQIPPARMMENEEAQWQLGGGQISGTFNPSAPDIAFFLSGLKKETCQQINHYLWNEKLDAEPAASGTSIPTWELKTADVLQLFGTKNRTEACIKTREGSYLYYKMVVSR